MILVTVGSCLSMIMENRNNNICENNVLYTFEFMFVVAMTLEILFKASSFYSLHYFNYKLNVIKLS